MTTGYYSLIQYCPDLSRLETVNVGVVLFCPELEYLGVRTSPNVRRVRTFFGKTIGGARQVKLAVSSIEARLKAARESFASLKEFENFAARQANAIQVTPPRQVLVETPTVELERLYRRLVSEKATRTVPEVRDVLEREFASAAYRPLIRRKVQVVVPVLRRAVTIPYGFKNGRFNLIQPAKFGGDTSTEILQTAGRFALEGDLLYQTKDDQLGPLKLVVVGQFPKGQGDLAEGVRRILAERHTELYRMEETPRLFETIRNSAKPLQQPGTPTDLVEQAED